MCPKRHRQQVGTRVRSFLGFVANKSLNGDSASYSFVLRGYVRRWLGTWQVCVEYNRITSLMLRVRGQRQSFVGLSPIGIAHADPGVTDLLIMHHRIVDQDVEAKSRHRQSADRREQGV